MYRLPFRPLKFEMLRHVRRFDGLSYEEGLPEFTYRTSIRRRLYT